MATVSTEERPDTPDASALIEELQTHLLRLETGIHHHEAIALYERSGFRQIPPFGPYRVDPVSLCYEKALT